MHRRPNGRREVLHQSHVSIFQSESQQDRHTMIGNFNKTTKDHREFCGREWSATGLTPSVTGVLCTVHNSQFFCELGKILF